MLLFGGAGMTAEFPPDPLNHVPDTLGGRDDVERRGRGAPLLEITYPQFAPGELPLDVGSLLRKQ